MPSYSLAHTKILVSETTKNGTGILFLFNNPRLGRGSLGHGFAVSFKKASWKHPKFSNMKYSVD
jgi:hypothetical protein